MTLDRQSGKPKGESYRDVPETYHGREEWKRFRGQELESRSQKGKDTDVRNVCDMGRGHLEFYLKYR